MSLASRTYRRVHDKLKEMESKLSSTSTLLSSKQLEGLWSDLVLLDGILILRAREERELEGRSNLTTELVALQQTSQRLQQVIKERQQKHFNPPPPPPATVGTEEKKK